MINVICTLDSGARDKYPDNRWPDKMVVRPMKGDVVLSDKGNPLIIDYVTHSMGEDGPILIVHLFEGEFSKQFQ